MKASIIDGEMELSTEVFGRWISMLGHPPHTILGCSPASAPAVTASLSAFQASSSLLMLNSCPSAICNPHPRGGYNYRAMQVKLISLVSRLLFSVNSFWLLLRLRFFSFLPDLHFLVRLWLHTHESAHQTFRLLKTILVGLCHVETSETMRLLRRDTCNSGGHFAGMV